MNDYDSTYPEWLKLTIALRYEIRFKRLKQAVKRHRLHSGLRHLFEVR